MRRVTTVAVGVSFAFFVLNTASAQKASVGTPTAAAMPASLTVPRAQAATPRAPECSGNQNALGVARVVEIDSIGGPGFGFEHFKEHNFLRQNEVVLTFDDGPWPGNTPAILAALAAHCTSATFFAIGKHAMWHPEILRDVAAAGHTVGSHTWSHADLSKRPIADAKDEVEKGVSAVRAALGASGAPFFRFPSLRHPPELVTYLGERNIAIFSTDLDSFDFRIRQPEKLVEAVMAKLRKNGRGIVLMHDFQHGTALALPELLKQLKEGGYRVVHLTAKDPVKTLPDYDALVAKEQKLPTLTARPTSSVVKTISE
jgi:peptidoglycan/xylan/chitin deacetylase (PgdA/CDA1 family)